VIPKEGEVVKRDRGRNGGAWAIPGVPGAIRSFTTACNAMHWGWVCLPGV